MIRLLSLGQEDGLFVVGDDDQSIYSFRGGSPAFIQNFAASFGPNPRIGRLAKSWRCPEHVLLGAKAVLAAYYTTSIPKPTPTFSDTIKSKDLVQVRDLPSDSREASFIASEAEKLLAENRIIILIPNAKYFPPIRDALRRRGLPYRYKANPNESGLVRFALLADCVEEPGDSLNMRHLVDLIISHDDTLTSSVGDPNDGITGRRTRASNLVAQLWARVDGGQSLHDVLVAEGSGDEDGFFNGLQAGCIGKAKDLLGEGGKRKSLTPFMELCGRLVAPGRNPNGIVDEVREIRNEMRQVGRAASQIPIGVHNLPSSKGLEADIVFVVGMSEGHFPNPNRDVAEQCRLFYVAMTRAKKRLYLLSSRTRSGGTTFKKDGFQLKPSPFVTGIPAEHVESKAIYPKKKPLNPKKGKEKK